MSNNEIIIYTKDYCPYCVRAKDLLNKKSLVYTEIDVTHDEDLKQQMVVKAGGMMTVPQIFIGDVHVGGCDNLYALEKEHKLDLLISSVNK